MNKLATLLRKVAGQSSSGPLTSIVNGMNQASANWMNSHPSPSRRENGGTNSGQPVNGNGSARNHSLLFTIPRPSANLLEGQDLQPQCPISFNREELLRFLPPPPDSPSEDTEKRESSGANSSSDNQDTPPAKENLDIVSDESKSKAESSLDKEPASNLHGSSNFSPESPKNGNYLLKKSGSTPNISSSDQANLGDSLKRRYSSPGSFKTPPPIQTTLIYQRSSRRDFIFMLYCFMSLGLIAGNLVTKSFRKPNKRAEAIIRGSLFFGPSVGLIAHGVWMLIRHKKGTRDMFQKNLNVVGSMIPIVVGLMIGNGTEKEGMMMAGLGIMMIYVQRIAKEKAHKGQIMVLAVGNIAMILIYLVMLAIGSFKEEVRIMCVIVIMVAIGLIVIDFVGEKAKGGEVHEKTRNIVCAMSWMVGTVLWPPSGLAIRNGSMNEGIEQC
ncbi:DUF1686 domain-containing protein [Encephalitozoon intestinalis]|nr:DUF1686 domain-containing protein [Encephalitozoon intestinalis]